jgi:hypothetical protein
MERTTMMMAGLQTECTWKEQKLAAKTQKTSSEDIEEQG